MAKRFYKSVDVKAQDDGYCITLDGHVLKTPGKQQLICPKGKQARLVADEWDAQIDDIKPEEMPCTRLMNVACEMTPSRRPELIAEFRKYCETDLLCYRSDNPKGLEERQTELWQPILEWVSQEHQIALAVTTGLEALPQPQSSLKASAKVADAFDDTLLTLLLHYTASLGSGVLALAVLDKYLSVDIAFELASLDELFQNERWGKDDEAVARNSMLLSELSALSHLI